MSNPVTSVTKPTVELIPLPYGLVVEVHLKPTSPVVQAPWVQQFPYNR
jgi:hypothetical protein